MAKKASQLSPKTASIAVQSTFEIQYHAMKLVSCTLGQPMKPKEGFELMQSNTTNLTVSQEFFVVRTGFLAYMEGQTEQDRIEILKLYVDHAFQISVEKGNVKQAVVSDPSLDLPLSKQLLVNIFATAHSSMRGVVMMSVRGTWLDSLVQNALTLETILSFDPDLFNDSDPVDLRRWMT